ncbi:MAG: flagellin-like protein [Lachnospiraceae bacterium]|nr:flagellin-like protein [Lachnospiraceae bacterium]
MLMMVRNMAFMAKMKVMNMLSDESGDVNIVSIVVLIGIAVLLAVIFKNEIIELLEGLFDTIAGTANDAVGGSSTTPTETATGA